MAKWKRNFYCKMKRQYFCIMVRHSVITYLMSFALAHQSKTNNAGDARTLTPTKYHSSSPSQHYINSLNKDYPDYLFHLQRTIDNQSVQRIMHSNMEGFDFAKIGIFQPKLKVSQPNDPYEQEADRVAEQVVRMPISDSVSPMSTAREQGIARECSACEMKKQEEADEKMINRKSPSNATSFAANNDGVMNEVNSVLSVGGGSSLDASTKKFMERRFGYDFSNVRVHSDQRAASSANSVGALAYTIGNDIVFGDGKYAPNTVEGRRVLAHELSHVVQQEENIALTKLGQPIVLRQTDAGVTDTGNVDQRATRPASRSIIQALLTADPISGVGDYPQVFRVLNGLAMFDMLATLDELKSLGYFALLIANFSQAIGVNQSRILIAMRAAEEKANNITTEQFAEKYQELFSALPSEQQTDIRTFLEPPHAPVSVPTRNYVFFSGSQLIVYRGGTEVKRVSAESGHPGRSENEPNVGPIPDGDYTISPHISRPTVATVQNGTCGALRIESGFQEITSNDPVPCSSPSHYCTVPCPTAGNPGQMCFTPQDCWGKYRIRIEGSRRVVTPTGTEVTRTGFYIHGGSHSVTSGCIHVSDDSIFSELRTFKNSVQLSVGKSVSP